MSEIAQRRALLEALCAGRGMTRGESQALFAAVMRGELSEIELAALLVALKAKGETADEIAGAAAAMREAALAFDTGTIAVADSCGTGGDGAETLNVSTAVALVVAEAGVAVAKHGNRAISSRCGSADVLERLGVRIEAPPAVSRRCLDELGLCFLFAPQYHAGVRHAMPVRRGLGVRTVFNLLGPLSNPAGAKRQLLGVYSTALVEPLARALKELGSEDALVVSSKDGLDELSLSAPTVVARLKGGKVTVSELDAAKLGLKRRPLAALKGGDAKRNAVIARAILQGEEGAPREVCLLNAAAALLVAGLARDWQEGLELAAESVDSGRALGCLRLLARLTNG